MQAKDAPMQPCYVRYSFDCLVPWHAETSEAGMGSSPNFYCRTSRRGHSQVRHVPRDNLGVEFPDLLGHLQRFTLLSLPLLIFLLPPLTLHVAIPSPCRLVGVVKQWCANALFATGFPFQKKEGRKEDNKTSSSHQTSSTCSVVISWLGLKSVMSVFSPICLPELLEYHYTILNSYRALLLC